MALKDISNRLRNAGQKADAVIEAWRNSPSKNEEALSRVVRAYIGRKLELPEEKISDNITIMVRENISAATGIPVEKLKEMDRPGACGSTPAVLAKRILLFIDIQDKLGVKMPPADAGSIQTVQDLAKELWPLIKAGNETDRI